MSEQSVEMKIEQNKTKQNKTKQEKTNERNKLKDEERDIKHRNKIILMNNHCKEKTRKNAIITSCFHFANLQASCTFLTTLKNKYHAPCKC